MSVPLNSVLLYEIETAGVDEPKPMDNMRTLDDAAVVAHARTGNMAAFEELVRRYRNDVYALSYHFMRNREEAWDVSQEVFIKAHRALSRFRGDASIKTWLLRIASNQCKDTLKKRRLKTVAIEDLGENAQVQSPARGPDDALAAGELGKAIDEALAALPVKHRTAFILREYEGLSYQEMAAVMGCSLGTVMSRLHHARQKLQKHLLRKGVVEDKTYA